MGRKPCSCCDKHGGLKKGAWSPEEDQLLINYINQHGVGDWISLPQNAGLQRCGKSCRLRWVNNLRPGIKRGHFTREEENLVIQLQTTLGNRWSVIAGRLPGRTDNEIKNVWNTHLKKRLLTKTLNIQTHRPTSEALELKPSKSSSMRHMAQCECTRLEAEAELSSESQIYNPYGSSASYSDVYFPPSVPKNAGLKHGPFTREEENPVVQLHTNLGRRKSHPLPTPCNKQSSKKGLWSPTEDQLLINYINQHGPRNWPSLAKNAGLQRNGKSCRLRWVNYLRPGLKRGPLTREEENLVIQLQTTLGNRWSAMAIQLPGRSESEIKDFWNTRLRKQRLVTKCLDPQTNEPASKAHGRFQKVGKTENTEKSKWQSQVSETSSSAKCASTPSTSGLNRRDEDIEVKEDSKPDIQLLNARSNSSCSDVVDDSSVSELQLLLDFPENNDTSFLEDYIYDSDVVDDSELQLQNNDTSFLENDIDDYLVYPSDVSND